MKIPIFKAVIFIKVFFFQNIFEFIFYTPGGSMNGKYPHFLASDEKLINIFIIQIYAIIKQVCSSIMIDVAPIKQTLIELLIVQVL